MSRTSPFPPAAFSNSEMSALIRAHDWAATPIGHQDEWSVSLRTLVTMMLASRFPMLIFWGPELITFYNDAFRPSLGNDGKHPSSLGQRGEESWAESWPVIGPMIYNIMAGGESVWFEDQKLPIYREGQMGYAYWTYSFSPVTDDDGQVNGVLVTCTETTQAVESLAQLNIANQELSQTVQTNLELHQKQQRTSEQLLRSQQQILNLFETTSIGIALLYGEDMIVQYPNSFYSHLTGRQLADLIDRPIMEVVPELEGQGFIELMQQVLHTGEPFSAKSLPATIMHQGTLETIYVDLTYQPWVEDGQTTGILVIAVEVTDQVRARQQLEQSEARLRSLIDSAPFPIGVYVGPELEIVLANKSIMDVWAKGYDVVGKSYRKILPELDNQPIFAQIEGVMASGQPFHARHQRVDIVVDGQLQSFYFNYSFTPLFDAHGQVYAVMNTAAEVTDLILARQALEQSREEYKTLSATLEQQVNERTLELATSNEELGASNEELTSINEELEETNARLHRSNDNLEKFAYVASHDLQEPLRKIQQFGNLLVERKSTLSSEESLFVDRMQMAASRMSMLIRDLLNYSRVDSLGTKFTPVPLNNVLDEVLSTLDLAISAARATVQIDPLPTIQGDSLQLEQLFQNLLGNALKFRQENLDPLIRITATTILADGLPASVRPARLALQYVRIDVIDNGIGFDEKYLDRIFQVFQRLHGKTQFSGTGIGLAICEKVMVHHGGAITATSQPGHGATFSLYFPD
ncbi:PAS domain-containing sensor histidine kinase [Spirosoma luteolum]